MQKIIIYILLVILWFCWYAIYSMNNQIHHLKSAKLETESCGASIENNDKSKAKSTNNTGRYISGNFTDGSQLLWKPSLVIWAWYFCKYCRDKIPKIEDMIYKPYSWDINIQINVMNFESQKFDTIIPQAPYESVTYASYIWKECNAFPTWIFTDAKWKVIANECWWTWSVENLAEIIKNNL